MTITDTAVKENGVTRVTRPMSGSAVWGPVTLYPDRTVVDRADVVKGRLQRKTNYPVFCDRSRIHGHPDGVNAYYTIDGTTNTGMITLTDCEIDGQRGNVAVAWSYYRLVNCDVRGGLDAVRLGQETHLADCHVHDLTRVEGSHNDILQLVNGSNSSVTHSTLRAYRAATDDPMNAVFQLGNLTGAVANVLIDDNLCDGGNYTFNANYSSGYAVTNLRVTNNRIGRNYRYGPAASITPHAGVTWAGNVYDDTLQAV
ncbi:MAG: hypothetical protein ACRDSK_13610 [Actinophytocola sp.]|uniref:hypothetical protein n=1 Tax=Actinophytocola sp. TaxID=1872138 RepID=UPI003D6BE31E